MKNNNYIFIAIGLISFLMTSCGKAIDEYFGVDNPESFSKIYSAQAVDDSIKHVFSFNIPTDTTIYIYANYGGLGSPTKDIKVKFKVASELVTTYNDNHDTHFPELLKNSYSIENNEVIIPKGKLRSTPLKIRLNTGMFDGIGNFILPMHIESVSDNISINDELRTAYLLISGKYPSNPFKLYDRTDWSIAGCSSEETYNNEGLASFVLDNQSKTYWCTFWKYSKPGPPHWIAIDMKQEKELHGVLIRGRADGSNPDIAKSTGNPMEVTILISQNGETWTEADSFQLTNDLENTLYLSHSRKVRFFKVFVTTNHGGMYQTNIAEISAF